MRPPLISLGLPLFAPGTFGPVGWSVGRFCSRFELADCVFAERLISAEVVSVEDGAHPSQRMASDGGDFGLGAFGDSEPGYCGTAQVIVRHANDTCQLARLAPRRPKAIRCPRFAVAVGEDDRADFRRGIERGSKRRADWNNHTRPSLPLP